MSSMVTVARLLPTFLFFTSNHFIVRGVEGTSIKMDFLPSGHVRTDPIVTSGCLSDHVHTFYGSNVLPFPDLDYQTLIDVEDDDNTGNVVENKSLYWHPTVYRYDRASGVHTRDVIGHASTYYVWENETGTRAFPPGFRMIAGTRGNDGTEFPNAYAECVDPRPCEREDCLSKNDFFPVTACAELEVSMFFPGCWDGVRLDSEDHSDHVAYAAHGDVDGECPDSHPVRIPVIAFFFRIFDYDGGWHEFSDGSSTFHADYISGWDEEHLQYVLDECENDSMGPNPDAFCENFLTFRDAPKCAHDGCDFSDPNLLEKLRDIQPELHNFQSQISPENTLYVPGELPRGACTGIFFPRPGVDSTEFPSSSPMSAPSLHLSALPSFSCDIDLRECNLSDGSCEQCCHGHDPALCIPEIDCSDNAFCVLCGPVGDKCYEDGRFHSYKNCKNCCSGRYKRVKGCDDNNGFNSCHVCDYDSTSESFTFPSMSSSPSSSNSPTSSTEPSAYPITSPSSIGVADFETAAPTLSCYATAEKCDIRDRSCERCCYGHEPAVCIPEVDCSNDAFCIACGLADDKCFADGRFDSYKNCKNCCSGGYIEVEGCEDNSGFNSCHVCSATDKATISLAPSSSTALSTPPTTGSNISSAPSFTLTTSPAPTGMVQDISCDANLRECHISDGSCKRCCLGYEPAVCIPEMDCSDKGFCVTCGSVDDKCYEDGRFNSYKNCKNCCSGLYKQVEGCEDNSGFNSCHVCDDGITDTDVDSTPPSASPTASSVAPNPTCDADLKRCDLRDGSCEQCCYGFSSAVCIPEIDCSNDAYCVVCGVANDKCFEDGRYGVYKNCKNCCSGQYKRVEGCDNYFGFNSCHVCD